MKRVRDEIRTHTAERPLPPQSSVSTNSTTRTSINLQIETDKKIRAKNGTRTRDPNLGKVVLYQLSYFRNCDAKVGIIFELANVLTTFFQNIFGTTTPESNNSIKINNLKITTFFSKQHSPFISFAQK